MEAVTHPMPLLPPGGLFEIIFSFDTTGSMSRAIEEVKGRIQDMIQRLQADIPGIRIGVIAHGDYCDKDVFYLEQHVDLSTNVAELCGFVKDVEGTGGGDPEECYEYILHMVRSFSWTPGSQRALVMIADAAPHEPDYDLNVENLNWKTEAEELARKGIKVYGVQAFDNADSTAFFKELVEITAGHHVQLGEFSNVCDFIMAICYRERGEEFFEGYAAEVQARERRMNKDLEGMFGTLRRGDSSASNVSAVAGTSSLVRNISSASSRSSASFRAINLSKSDSVSSSSSRPGCSGVAPPVGIVLPVTATPTIKARKVNFKHANGVKKNTTKVANPPATKGLKKKNVTKSKDNVGKVLRHETPDTQFILKKGNLKKRWSNWKLAMSFTEPEVNRNWIKRSETSRLAKGKLGWRRKELFPWKPSNGRVMYEICVQEKKAGRMFIVYSKWSTLNADPMNWEKRMLGNKLVQQNIEKVLKKGYKVFIRRFGAERLGKNQRESVRDFKNTYDYDWPMADNSARKLLF